MSDPSDEKVGTGLLYQFYAYHERELLPQREALSHLRFTVRMTGVADDASSCRKCKNIIR